MKVIILAAGEGKRLKPFTDDTPKCLLQIKRKSILSLILKTLNDLGFSKKEILIVTGHLSNKIKEKFRGYNYLFNPLYSTANNIYSLFLANEFLRDEGFILINSDNLTHPLLVRKFLYSHLGSFLLIDDYKNLGKEEMKVKMNKRKIVRINKEMPPSRANGEYIGLAKFSKRITSRYFKVLNILINDGYTNLWYEDALNKILHEEEIYGVSTDGLPWIEIDTYNDLKKAELVLEKIQKDGYFS